MEFREGIKQLMHHHRRDIELFQWAVMNGVGSMVYSEYIMNMKHKLTPTEHLSVVSIKRVTEFMGEYGWFCSRLKEELIDRIVENPIMNEVSERQSEIPEFVIFKEDMLEMLKVIADLYIVPNLSHRIPEVIAKKFQIGDPNPNVNTIENSEADFFKENIDLDGLTNQIVLQLIIMNPSIKKKTRTPENMNRLQLSEDDILIIENKNGICPVCFSYDTLIDDLNSSYSFITSTSLHRLEYVDKTILTPETNKHVIILGSTSPFNTVKIVDPF